MSDAETTFVTIAAEQGWSLPTQLNVLLRYIDNQQSDDVFRDFLLAQQEFENDESVDG